MSTENKQFFIFKSVFPYITERKKLDLIIYNKNIQNLFNINVKYYKSMSGKYKIGEKDGIGKEYDFNDKLLFEGEYKNGKKNGKGKEYIYDSKEKKTNYIKFTFEGEYLNGEKNGKGKIYNSNNNLIFDGEFKNGYKLLGKGYDNDGNIIYEINNKLGKGKDYYYDGILQYEGEFIDGERNGIGKEYSEKGKLIFEGEYKKDERNGYGREYNSDDELEFEGEYINGKKKWKRKRI